MSEKSTNPALMQKDFYDYCYFPNLLLSSIVGYEFRTKPQPIWWTILRKCYFVLAIVSQIYIFTFIAKATFIMITSDNFELALLLRLISGFNYMLFATLKSLTLLWHVNEFKEIYENLRDIFPKTRREKLIYRVRDYFWPKWILSILYFYLGAVAFITISPLIDGIISYVVSCFKVGWRQAEFGYSKLYEIEYSFDHHNIFGYLLTYAMELMHAHFVVTFNVCADVWLLCITLQLCMHFDYVARTLENYRPNKKSFAKDQQFIAVLVQRHQILLNIGDGLNKVYGFLLMLLLMSIAGTLCCAGIYTLTQGLGREFLEYVAFLPTAIGQYYIICYYGQQLIIKSQGVAEAAYNHAWYNGSQSYKKSIFIILMRSQKEVELNALGFQPICLEAFKMVMGATYRVFALLKETMF